MTPYFQTDQITLFLADCLPAMREMGDKAFKLALVDPPYGDSKIFNGSADYANKLKQYSNQRPPDEYFKELFRISSSQIIWGANYFPYSPGRGWIIWDKVREVDNYSRFELAYTSFDRHPQMFTFCNNAGFVLREEDRPKTHPTQKPVALYRWLLTNYAKPGDTILDTHLGSGSIAIACIDLGFHLTGYEIDEEYLSGAVKRIERHLRQPKLFTPKPAPMTQEALL